MTLGQGCRYSERDLLETLKRLNGLCSALKQNRTSSLDPMAQFCVQTDGMARNLQFLIEKHSKQQLDDISALQRSFSDIQILNSYNEVLLTSTRLIFSVETPFFRLGKRPEFAVHLVKLYTILTGFQGSLGARATQLSSVIHAFEYQFNQSFNIANCNVLRLDQVHDLLSHSFDLVSPPLIDINDLTKRDYFRLSMNKYNVDRQLVEILQFSSGELAIFRVNSGEIPNLGAPPSQQLTTLAQGNYSILNLGRTLLFPILRECDLEIINNLSSGTELKTTTGNGICLKLQCVDPVQWESHWKICFKRLFDKSDVIQLTPRSYSSASLAKSSHVFQSFKLKHSKLEELRPASNTGLPLKIPQPALATEEDKAPIQNSPPQVVRSGLRRSKPLRRPLSVLMGINEEEEKKRLMKAPISPDTPPSYEDLESFNCEKLLELDKTIQMEMSPVSMGSAVMQQVKSASQHSSLDQIAPTLGQDIELSGEESVLSLDEEDSLSDSGSTFNPSADFYKPTLYRRKSTSLLSLFSSKNKKKLVVDTAAANASVTSVTSSRSNTPSSAKSGLPTCATTKDFELLPRTIDLNNDLAIFESENIKASLWDGRQWMKFGADSLKVSILKSDEDKTVMVLYERKDESKCIFAAHISPKWKCSKAAAQDLQIVIPTQNLIVSILPPGSNTINMRSSTAEKLKNSLQHCIKGNLPSFIPSSQTAATLSSVPSTFSSRGVTRSSTALSELANFKNKPDAVDSHLLLPSVKVKIHKKVGEKGWQAQKIGFVDIFSQEYKGSAIAVKFEYFGGNEETEKPLTFCSHINGVHRIGRTGLLVASEGEERLLEFMNNIVAGQVYKLIKPF